MNKAKARIKINTINIPATMVRNVCILSPSTNFLLYAINTRVDVMIDF